MWSERSWNVDSVIGVAFKLLQFIIRARKNTQIYKKSLLSNF